MATVPQKTLNWLWDVLRREYRDPQRAYSDLAQSIALYPGLAPRTDVYTSENGAPALLLHLKGTLPVTFKGSLYHFPIAVWVPHAYPYEPPILYVTPTDDIVIRQGQHVSGSDGRIYHPYLARWREAWDRCTIADFLKLLVDIFAREPPVMSRLQAAAPPPRPASLQQPPPRPPLPGEQRPPSARPPSIASNGPPPPPPKGNEPSNTVPQPGASPAPARPSRYDVPPPLPSQPAPPRPPSIVSPPPQQLPQPNQYHSQYQGQYQPPRQDQLRASQPVQQQPPPIASQFPLRQSFGSMPVQGLAQQPQGQTQYQQPGQNRSYIQNAQSQPPQSPYQVQQSQQPMPQPRQQQQQQPQTYMPTPQPAPQAPKPKPQQPNLMDESPFDISMPTTNANLPTPVIPPNPEKQQILHTLSATLLSTLQNQISQSSANIAPLQSQHSALQAAEQTLQSELAQLKTLQGQLSQNVDSLTSTIKAADRTISSGASSSSANKIPSVDELIIPPTVVARQLYDAVAEQRGYEAAIYALTEGFVRGRIGSELWARKTRECAREEFRRKYLVKKRLGTGMGLDTSQM